MAKKQSAPHIYDIPDMGTKAKAASSAPPAKEHIYDTPPIELNLFVTDGTEPAGAKETVVYDTVPFERIAAESSPSPPPHTEDRAQWFRALFTFESSIDGEVSFSVGDLLRQVPGEEREQKGWIMVEKNGEQGWAPASYLEPEEVEPVSQEPQGM